MKQLNRAMAASGLALALFGSAGMAVADEEGAIEHRKAVYQAVGGHMKAMVAIVKGKVPHTGDLQYHAQAMANLSQSAGRAFPEGSDFGETNAKAIIWEDTAKFAAAMKRFQGEAAKLASVAAKGDVRMTAGQIGELGKACKNCHDTFREKHDH